MRISKRSARPRSQRTSTRIILVNGVKPSQGTKIASAFTYLTRVLPRVSPTAVLPRYRHTRSVPTTILADKTLPLPKDYLPVPPSARHAKPAVTK